MTDWATAKAREWLHDFPIGRGEAMSTVEHWKTAWRRGMDEARQSALAAAEAHDREVRESAIANLKESAKRSHESGFRAGLERAAQAVRDAGGDNEDYHVDAIRSLSAPAQEETP